MAEDIHASLQAEGVHYVRVMWCDNANVIRAKAAHVGCSGGWIAAVNGVDVLTVPDEGLPGLNVDGCTVEFRVVE